MKNLQIIEIKTLAPTNTKGTRLSYRDNRFNTRIIQNMDYQYNTTKDQAIAFLQSKGYIVIGTSFDETREVYSIIVDSKSHSFINLGEV